MNYPVVIQQDPKSDYGVEVPDLPGCFSAGSTLDEALANTREAIELHLEGLIDDGQPVPLPGSIDGHQRKAEYRGGTWAIVSVDHASLRLKAVRINVTVPERILDAVDRYAASHGKSRSGLLVEAVTDYIGRGSNARSQRGSNRHPQQQPKKSKAVAKNKPRSAPRKRAALPSKAER